MCNGPSDPRRRGTPYGARRDAGAYGDPVDRFAGSTGMGDQARRGGRVGGVRVVEVARPSEHTTNSAGSGPAISCEAVSGGTVGSMPNGLAGPRPWHFW